MRSRLHFFPVWVAKRYLVLFLWGVLLGAILCPTEALAKTTPGEFHILGRITTDHKRVSLLDLCDRTLISEEWQQLLQQVDVGEAPSGGAEKYIDPGTLRSFLCRFIESQGVACSQIQMHLPSQIVVARQSVQLSQEQIEAAYRKFVLDNTPWNSQDVAIQRVSFSGTPVVPVGELTHEVLPSPKEKFLGNVTVTINFFVDGEKARSLRVTGRVDVYQNVVHAARALRQNETITDSDIELQRIIISDASDRYITQPEQAINMRLLHNVGAHQPIDFKNLDKPLILKKGDVVSIIYDQPGLKVTAKGQANQDGKIGDTVRVNNITSNRTVLCRVIDAQTVQAAY